MKTRRPIFTLLLCALAATGPSSARAADFLVAGDTITISGQLFPREWDRFRQTLEAGEGKNVTKVLLNSIGGEVHTGGEIGRIVREHRLTTIVDAARHRCMSACTLVFAGGATRIYLHAPNTSGLGQTPDVKGLGFHEGRVNGFGDKYAQIGPSNIAKFYLMEFGVAGAVDLIDKATAQQIYIVSGRDALALGIATRTSM